MLSHALANNQIEINSQTKSRLETYLALVRKWNKVFNLTAITDPAEMIYLHLIDSLAVLPFLNGKHCLDVGSGAGFPGMALAIANPAISWVLLDKSQKKARFLTQVVAELSLTNVKIVSERVENFHPACSFDTILCRAFSSLNAFVECTRHLISPGGQWIAMKGKYPDQEINTLGKVGLEIKTIPLDIKGVEIIRHLIVISKRG